MQGRYNLRMAKPGLMAVVNTLPIIHECKARGKILILAIFSSQEVLSLHFSFKVGVTITLISSTY